MDDSRARRSKRVAGGTTNNGSNGDAAERTKKYKKHKGSAATSEPVPLVVCRVLVISISQEPSV